MASSAAYTAIHDFLVANWLAPLPGLRFENDGQDPPADGSAFVYVEIESEEDDQASIGGGDQPDDNLWREVGGVSIEVLIERGTGTAQGRIWRDQLGALFKGLTLAGIKFRTQRFLAGTPYEGNGNYFSLPLVIEFERDH